MTSPPVCGSSEACGAGSGAFGSRGFVDRNRCPVHLHRHCGLRAVAVGVADLVGELVGSVVALVGRVGDGAIGIYRDGSVRGLVNEPDGYRFAVHLVVVVHDRDVGRLAVLDDNRVVVGDLVRTSTRSAVAVTIRRCVCHPGHTRCSWMSSFRTRVVRGEDRRPPELRPLEPCMRLTGRRRWEYVTIKVGDVNRT